VPRLILQFDDQVLKECGLGLMATIGRLPDNNLVIDNPAVSGHHACVFRDGDRFVVEDLESTNGTFVNEQRVSRHTLHDGDVVAIGKHKLVFEQTGGVEDTMELPMPTMSNLRDTVFLDTQKHRAMIAKLKDPNGNGDGSRAAAKIGVLRVVAGRTDQDEYSLDAHTCLIGKAPASLVRLKGWFKPSVALAITRNGQSYTATVLNGRTHINSEPLRGRHALNDGDVLRVSGLTLQFRLKE